MAVSGRVSLACVLPFDKLTLNPAKPQPPSPRPETLDPKPLIPCGTRPPEVEPRHHRAHKAETKQKVEANTGTPQMEWEWWEWEWE